MAKLAEAVPAGLSVLAGTLLFAAAFWLATRLLESRSSSGSWLGMLAGEARLPLVLLALYLGGKAGIEQLLPAGWEQGEYVPGLLESLPATIALSWILLRCIARIEESGVQQYSRKGWLKLPASITKLSPRDRQLMFIGLRIAGWSLIGLILLNAAGVSLAGLLAFGGAGGLIIGFAAKEILTDIIAGFMVVWSDEFEIGEWVKLRGTDIEGVIEHYDLRYTLVRTFDKRPLYVPNSMMIAHVIENPNRMTHRRIYEYVGLRYSDMGKLPAVLADVRQMLTDHPGIDSTQAQLVAFDRYGGSAIEFYIYCMTSTTGWQESVEIKEDVLLKVADIVQRHGADFAFPTTTVHIDSMPPGPAAPEPAAAPAPAG